MTLDQLRALCNDQWNQDYGDVTALSLTAESLSEFSCETITHGDPFQSAELRVRGKRVPAARTGVGVLVTGAINPVTRSVIKIGLAVGGGADTATVRYGAHAPDRTVALEAAH